VATLTWDSVGARNFQTGVNRGVLYLPDGSVVPWNGLKSIEESSLRESKSYFLDGVKYLESVTPGDYAAKLEAFTYPDEFDRLNGVVDVTPGLSYYDQPPDTFGLSYQTRLGNDTAGVKLGYKIHLLYNMIAVPEDLTFETLQSPLQPVAFVWTLAGVPPKIAGYRPTVHISIDSMKTSPETLEILENILYGSDVNAPRLPPIDEIKRLFATVGVLIIVDNGDGTWTAIDTNNDFITMLDDTTFQIAGADAEYIDASTYTISTTEPD
jgi:hypothetical protein